MNPSEIFDNAANTIESNGWCRGFSAVDNHGMGVNWGNPKACSFCLMGSVWKSLDEAKLNSNEQGMVMSKFYEWFEDTQSSSSPIHWNDVIAKDKEEVVTKLREARDSIQW